MHFYVVRIEMYTILSHMEKIVKDVLYSIPHIMGARAPISHVLNFPYVSLMKYSMR